MRSLESRRFIGLRGVIFVLLLGFGILVWLTVGPVVQTRRALREVRTSRLRDDARLLTIEKLGGREKAAWKLGLYIRLPQWAAPDKIPAVDILSACGPPAVPELIDALAHKNTKVRASAAGSLGDIGPAARAAVPILIDLLRTDRHPPVRGNAALAVSEIDPSSRSAVPALADGLKDGDDNLKISCLMALAQMGPCAEGALPALIEIIEIRGSPRYMVQAFGRHDMDIRSLAASALESMGPAAREAIPALERLAAEKDVDSLTEASARTALEKIRGPAEE